MAGDEVPPPHPSRLIPSAGHPGVVGSGSQPAPTRVRPLFTRTAYLLLIVLGGAAGTLVRLPRGRGGPGAARQLAVDDVLDQRHRVVRPRCAADRTGPQRARRGLAPAGPARRGHGRVRRVHHVLHLHRRDRHAAARGVGRHRARLRPGKRGGRHCGGAGRRAADAVLAPAPDQPGGGRMIGAVGGRGRRDRRDAAVRRRQPHRAAVLVSPCHWGPWSST